MTRIGKIAMQLQNIGLDKIQFVTVPTEYYPRESEFFGSVFWTEDADTMWQLINEDKPLPQAPSLDAAITAEPPATSSEAQGGGAGETPSGTRQPEETPSESPSEEASPTEEPSPDRGGADGGRPSPACARDARAAADDGRPGEDAEAATEPAGHGRRRGRPRRPTTRSSRSGYAAAGSTRSSATGADHGAARLGRHG